MKKLDSDIKLTSVVLLELGFTRLPTKLILNVVIFEQLSFCSSVAEYWFNLARYHV